MQIRVKDVNRLFLLATAPFLGLALWLIIAGDGLSVDLSDDAFPTASLRQTDDRQARTTQLAADLELAYGLAEDTAASIKRSALLYDQTTADVGAVVKTAAAQVGKPLAIYDRRITLRLGSASERVQSDKLSAQLYFVKAQNFIGYAMKVRLKSDQAMTMVLGDDKFGGSETTLSAVKRYKAFAGVNAGGFADSGGKRYPLSTTVLDGEYVNGFEPTFKDLFFVGLSEDRKLIGGEYTSREQLDKLKPKFGASFVPILLKNGQPQTIPDKWRKQPHRAPRTVIGNYKDDQLLILVTDGYDERGGSGATLEELQILLQRLGVKDAYNLDGGGSSSLIFNGRVVNNPSDGKLRSLATHFLFFK